MTTGAGPAAEQPSPAEGSLADRRVVVIATPLEAELVALIEAVDDRLDVRYEPDGRTRRSTSTALRTGSLSSLPGPTSW